MNKWDSKRIAFISILIAMSISFVIIGTRFAAIGSFPNIKISLAGLPIKIIGYIFGPLIGFVIGFTTDVISFVFMPTFYHPIYSLCLAISGTIPGLSSFFFNYVCKLRSKKTLLRRLKNKYVYLNYLYQLALLNNTDNKINKKILKLNEKIDKISSWKQERSQLNFTLANGFVILTLSLIVLVSIFILLPQDGIDNALKEKGLLKLISNKIVFIVLISLGIVVCMISLVVYRLRVKKESNFIQYTSIVVLVVITEYVNVPIVAYADLLALKIDFATSIIAHVATSNFKIWFNLVIITFAIKVVLPLINKKTFNGYM